MFAKGNTESAEEDYFKKFEEARAIWAGSQANYKSGDEFYGEFAIAIDNMAQILGGLTRFHFDEHNRIETRRMENEAEAKRSEEFANGSKVSLEKQTKELVDKRKHLDAVKSKMRDVLRNLNAKKLCKLPVDTNPHLNKFFTKIWDIYYKNENAKFDWPKFKKFAFEKDNCDDFTARLISYNFGSIDDNTIREINEFKSDSFIDEFSRNEQAGENILDIIDYLDLVENVALTQREIDNLEKEMKKIQIEAPLRKLKAKNLRDQVNQSKETQEFLNENHSKYTKFLENFDDEIKKFLGMSESYLAHKEKVKAEFVD